MKEKTLLSASLVTAVVASLCCTLPLIAAIAGISAAGVSGFFAAWRPYLLGVAAVLLALGFYFSYRKTSQACEPGSACEHPAASRYGRLGLWITTTLVILFAAFPYYSPAAGKLLLSGNKARAASPAAALQHVNFAVEGMTCPVCAQGVEHRLKSLNGVQQATVSFERKKAEIDYDPKLVKLEQLEQPFQDAGFKAIKQ